MSLTPFSHCYRCCHIGSQVQVLQLLSLLKHSGCPHQTSGQIHPLWEFPEKNPLAGVFLVSSVDFTEKFGKCLHKLHSRQLKSPSIFLVSVVPPQCHHWFSQSPVPRAASTHWSTVCSFSLPSASFLLIPQDHSPLLEAMSYKVIKEWKVLILQLVVYFSLHLFPGP